MAPQEFYLEPRPLPLKILRDPKGLKQLNSALWLYLVLLSAASRQTGQLQTTAKDLATLTQQKPETVSSLLGHLAKHDYVVVRKHSGWLQIRIVDWPALGSQSRRAPGSPAPAPRPAPEPEPEDEIHEPISGSQALALRIAQAFEDEANLDRYEELVESFPHAVIERAYRDAAAMPADQIRKSRGAVFTYLLRKYDNNNSD